MLAMDALFYSTQRRLISHLDIILYHIDLEQHWIDLLHAQSKYPKIVSHSLTNAHRHLFMKNRPR